MNFSALWTYFSHDFLILNGGNLIMIGVGLILIYLAIVREYEPVLLLPIGFGCILANLGMAASADGEGFPPCYTAPASNLNFFRY
jgi:Na+-transporting methylmalonyl-CoA/oxaloacetate decarboxylase, beta subunit